jgi:hypothetical protein
VEPGGEDLRLVRPGQQVAGDLLDGEPIERHIRVDGVDHPVPPAVGIRPGIVLLVPIAVAVPRQVQPVPAQALAEVG